MTRTLEIDDEVWEWLKARATPFEDTPNSVLREIAGLGRDSPPTEPHSASKRRIQIVSQAGGRSDLLRPFLRKLETTVTQQSGSVAVWQAGSQRRTPNIVEVTPRSRKTPLLLYIKTRSEGLPSGGFWGLRKNQLDALIRGGKKWSVALLLGPGEKGFVLPSDYVERSIRERRWSFTKGDFKIHENHEIEGSGSRDFNDWKTLIASIIQ